MNVVFLNLTRSTINGVAKAFEFDQLITINARGTNAPIAELQKFATTRTIDVIAIAATRSSEINKPRAAEVIHNLRQAKIKQPILLLNDLQSHELTSAMLAGPIVLPLQLDLELATGGLHINDKVLQVQSVGLSSLGAGKPGNDFEFCGFMLTGLKPSKVLFLGKEISLGRKEREFLGFLIRAQGNIVSRDTLHDRLYLPDEEHSDLALNDIAKRTRNFLKAHFRVSSLPFNAGDIIYSSYGDGYGLSVKNVEILIQFFSSLPTVTPIVILPEAVRQITNKFVFCGFSLNRASGEIQFHGEGLELGPIHRKIMAALILAEGKPLPMQKLISDLRAAKLSSCNEELYDQLSLLRKALRKNLQSLGYSIDQPLIESVEGQGWRLSTDYIERLTKYTGQKAGVSNDTRFADRLRYWINMDDAAISKLECNGNRQSGLFSFHGFTFQRGAGAIEFHGENIGLTKKESAAFAVLLLAEGQTVPLKEIHAAIRSLDDTAGESATNTLMLKSRKRLKSFLEKEGHPPEMSLILTVRGRGYRLSIESLTTLDDPTSPARTINLAARRAYNSNAIAVSKLH